MKQSNKNILITGGGTIVKIDDVRHIGNFSTGSFSSKIAEAVLKKGHKVFYLHAKNAKLPQAHKNLRLISFETYDDYVRELKDILGNNKIDIAYLGAAVSDYGVVPFNGKISSFEKEVVIKLFQLPKVIESAREWSKKPFFQVGFKLLSNVSEKELIEVGYKSGVKNRSHLTLANDLAKIKSGKREAILITPERGAIKLTEPNIAEKIVDFVEERASAIHFKTVVSNNKTLKERFKNEINLFIKMCSLMNKKRLMPDFFNGAESGHGSLSLRIDDKSFLITSRSSSKKRLKPDEIVLVKKVDWVKKIIYVESVNGEKASFNAILSAAIFEKFPNLNAIVHTHSFYKGAPTTSFPYTPGTLEYTKEPVKMLKHNQIINLKNHGLIAVGKDLKETIYHVLR